MDILTFELQKGKSFNQTITVTDSNGAVFNMSGYNLRSTIRSSLGATDTMGSFDLSYLNQISGRINLAISPSGSTGYHCGSAWGDIEAYTLNDTDVIGLYPIVKLEIYPELTRIYS